MADILFALAGIMAMVLFWVTLYDSNRFVIRKYAVKDEKIKKPCRAVFLTDLHNKRYGKENELLLEAVRAQEPDFIFIAGDMITARPGASMEPALKLLGELAKEYRIFYANGNHEHRMKLYPDVYGDMADHYTSALKEMGIEPMVNGHTFLPEYGIAVYGSEIHEKFYRRFALEEMDSEYLCQTLGQAPEDAYTVLLAHNPDYLPEYAVWGAELVLSGHVHGGVARVPIWGKGVIAPTMRLFPKYDGGIFREGRAVMVLSRGLGTHTIPVRAFNPAELWVVDFS